MSIQDECVCSVACAGKSRCACMYDYEEDTCSCVCGPPRVASAFRKMSTDRVVDICIKNAELSLVAEFLSRACEEELFIPAARARSRVTLSLKKTSLANVIEQTGLRIGLPG